MEYTLDSCQEPHLFLICKQRRQTAESAVALMFYYILDGSIYQTPTIHGALSARLVSPVGYVGTIVPPVAGATEFPTISSKLSFVGFLHLLVRFAGY